MLSDAEKIHLFERMCKSIPFAVSNNIKVEQVCGDEVTIRLPYRPELVGNPEAGEVHSSAMTALMDHILGVACLCCDKADNTVSVTLDLRIDHLGTVPAGNDILATARVFKVTRRVLFVEGFAYWDSRDNPVVKASGAWMLVPGLSLEDLISAADTGARQQ